MFTPSKCYLAYDSVGKNTLSYKNYYFSFFILSVLYTPPLGAQKVKCLLAMWETWVRSPGWEDLLEKEVATHSSILAWKITWMEKPSRLQPTGLDTTEYLNFTSLCTHLVHTTGIYGDGYLPSTSIGTSLQYTLFLGS